MFNHYTYILVEHHVALRSCISNHNTVTPPLLAHLYKSALANLVQPQTEPGFATSRLQAGTTILATATDLKTGFFVQLAKLEGREQPLLTAGAKWAMETTNLMQGNTATQLW